MARVWVWTRNGLLALAGVLAFGGVLALGTWLAWAAQ